ncbi:MAG: thioredoxin [Flavobacteriia bacterium]|jgi:thioredoxin 1|nr:thioredoxin [Flavobacteriia bacterium]
MSHFNKILSDNKPVLLDFYADWCGPCKMMAPVLTQLKEKMGDRLRILKIDVDKNQSLAAQYQVRGVPTLVLMQHQNVVWKQSGVMDINTLQQTIEKHL